MQGRNIESHMVETERLLETLRVSNDPRARTLARVGQAMQDNLQELEYLLSEEAGQASPGEGERWQNLEFSANMCRRTITQALETLWSAYQSRARGGV